MHASIVRLSPVVVPLAIAMVLSGCRGAPCGNCGWGGNNYQQYGNYYGQQPYAPATVPSTTAPGVMMPQGTTVQPGYQYPPGTVPVAPQQLPPGAIYGG